MVTEIELLVGNANVVNTGFEYVGLDIVATVFGKFGRMVRQESGMKKFRVNVMALIEM